MGALASGWKAGLFRQVDAFSVSLPTYFVNSTFWQPNKVEVLPGGLEGIPDGLERLRNKGVSGVKLVVRPEDTAY